jgi:hypothetical protein
MTRKKAIQRQKVHGLPSPSQSGRKLFQTRPNGGMQAVDVTIQPIAEPETLRGMVLTATASCSLKQAHRRCASCDW